MLYTIQCVCVRERVYLKVGCFNKTINHNINLQLSKLSLMVDFIFYVVIFDVGSGVLYEIIKHFSNYEKISKKNLKILNSL